MGTATKARLDAVKAASKEVVNETAETRGRFMGNQTPKTPKLSKLWSDSTVSKLLTRKCIKVIHLFNGQCSVKKNMKYETPPLRLDLCYYSDVYIVVKGKRTVKGTNNVNIRNKKITYNSNVPYRSCVSKINNTSKGNTEDLDIAMLMYNQLQYSENCPIKSGSEVCGIIIEMKWIMMPM